MKLTRGQMAIELASRATVIIELQKQLRKLEREMIALRPERDQLKHDLENAEARHREAIAAVRSNVDAKIADAHAAGAAKANAQSARNLSAAVAEAIRGRDLKIEDLTEAYRQLNRLYGNLVKRSQRERPRHAPSVTGTTAPQRQRGRRSVTASRAIPIHLL